jgi:hypothetical protein
MGRSAPARTQTMMCRWRTGSPVECTQEIQACHDPSRSWRSQHSRCPTGPPVSSTIGGDAGLRPYSPPSRSTTVSGYETKFERVPNGAGSPGSMGRNDLETTEDRYTIGGSEAGGSQAVPRPAVPAPSRRGHHRAGRLPVGNSESPRPAERSPANHRCPDTGRSQVDRSVPADLARPVRPRSLRGSPMTPAERAECGTTRHLQAFCS